MPGDYPDWTDLVQLIGTDIMLAIDIQGAYIMMPVDIQGQIGELNINITASEVIVNIDIEAQSVGIHLEADWQAVARNDKSFNMSFADQGWSAGNLGDYAVPGAKTLFITFVSFYLVAALAADYDHFIRGYGWLGDLQDAKYAYLAGESGACSVLVPPLVISGGHTFRMVLANYSNVTCFGGMTALGYEV
jgi:hypothetical protein